MRLTHFGNSARLRLTAYSTGTAQVVYWDSILITGGPDELDVAIQRLVHGMETGKPVRESAELETVTDKETMALNRREANKSFGVRLTELLPFNAAGRRLPAGHRGRAVLAVRRALLDGRPRRSTSAAAPRGASSSTPRMGAYYPFLREDFTPYLGGPDPLGRDDSSAARGRAASRPAADGGYAARAALVGADPCRGRLLHQHLRRDASSTRIYPTTGHARATHYSQGFVFSAGIGF